MPSEQFKMVLAMARSRPIEPTLSVEKQRENFETSTEFFAPDPDAQFEPVRAPGVVGEWVSTPGVSKDGALLYFHGGGYSIGSLRTHRGLISNIVRASGIRALSIDYRLAPENRFPAALVDAIEAYRLLIQTVDPKHIVIGGDSAGGGLTAATLVALRDAGDLLPAAAILLSPWTDLAGTGDSMQTRAAEDPLLEPIEIEIFAKHYLGDLDRKMPLASPLYANLEGLPPLLIHVGTAEILLDDSTRFAERARAAGVDVTMKVAEDMIHVWHFFGALTPEGKEATAEVGAFIRAHIGA